MKRINRFFTIFIAVVVIGLILFTSGQSRTTTITAGVIPQAGSARSQNTEKSEQALVSKTSTENIFVNVNTSNTDYGVIEISTNIETTSNLKVKVSLNSETLYYDIESIDTRAIPLQMGNGTYAISIFKNISGDEYKQIYSTKVEAEIDNSNTVFLNSNAIVNYDESGIIRDLAYKFERKSGKTAQLEAVYKYVVANIDYDYTKYDTLKSDYIPNVEDILSLQKGICYDYSAVTASILRQMGIPTKLVMGYRVDSEIYHAWNEVYINGQWQVMDTTLDSSEKGFLTKSTMFKDSDLYVADKFF